MLLAQGAGGSVMNVGALCIKFCIYIFFITHTASCTIYASSRKPDVQLFDPKAIRLVCKRDAQGVLHMRRVTEQEYQQVRFATSSAQQAQKAGSEKQKHESQEKEIVGGEKIHDECASRSVCTAQKVDPLIYYGGVSCLRRGSSVTKNSKSDDSDDSLEYSDDEAEACVQSGVSVKDSDVMKKHTKESGDQDVFSFDEDLIRDELVVSHCERKKSEEKLESKEIENK